MSSTERPHACHCSNELCNADNTLKLLEAERDALRERVQRLTEALKKIGTYQCNCSSECGRPYSEEAMIALEALSIHENPELVK